MSAVGPSSLLWNNKLISAEVLLPTRDHMCTLVDVPILIQGFPDSSVVKNLPAMQKTPVRFLGQEDLLEKR